TLSRTTHHAPRTTHSAMTPIQNPKSNIQNPPAPFTTLPLRVGHWTHPGGQTGCTVVLCPPGTVASGEVRGPAPGTRETDLLRPGGLVQTAHAVLLTGGSAFGLAAADGVMRYLQEQGVGYEL